jgi:hypothetical protein
MSNEATPTLGQRIDAVLDPLYLEAEQYRQTIAQVTEQKRALQEQIEQAEQGLGKVESRMAQVVRELAKQEPVIAAVVGQTPDTVADEVAAPAEPTKDDTEAQEATAETPAAEPTPQPQAETTANTSANEDDFFEEEPHIELDPEADAETVGEAAALLDEAPAQEKPKVDLAAAAERAAAAAKQLREKAASN